MDIFEKQQTIEAIKTVIKARWFYIGTILLTGFVVKLSFSGVPLLSILDFSLIALAGFSYNFIYLMYIRRRPEKISDLGLKIVKILQVIGDQFAISAILYFSGTANKIMVVFYVVTIMIASSLYGKKGIIFATIFSMIVYSGTVLIEYSGLMRSLSPEEISQATGVPLRGNSSVTKVVLASFNFYFIAVAFVAANIAGLFRRREKLLIGQKNELTEKSNTLTLQTKELTKAKGEIQDALTRSDVARKAATRARDEMEKANLELKKKVDELEKFYNITIGREVRMAELKQRIKELEGDIKKLKK